MLLTYSTPSGVDRSANASTTDATVAIGIMPSALISYINTRNNCLYISIIRKDVYKG